MAAETRGLLVITIDADTAALAEHSEAAVRLAKLLGAHRVPATWALEDPATSEMVETLRSEPAGHEIALLGDARWIGANGGRTLFARQLAGRVEAARAAGLRITSLALRDCMLDQHLDLLVKHKIVAVRQSGIARQNESRLIRPQLFRFGIWQATASCRLPAESGFWRGETTICSTLKRAVQRDEIAHVWIDLQRLAADEAQAMATLDASLTRAGRYVVSGKLVTRTLGDAVARLSQHSAPPRRGRSILRTSAA